MILDFIVKFGSANRKDLNHLLVDKLSDLLTEKQKMTKITNILSELSKRNAKIKNIGTDKFSK